MKKTLFLTLLSIIGVKSLTVPVMATDSAVSFEALQRQEEKTQEKPKKKPKKTTQKQKAKAVPRTSSVIDKKPPETEEQICFQDDNGETWCALPDENPPEPPVETTDVAPLSGKHDDQVYDEINELEESAAPVEPILIKPVALSKDDAERNAQEANEQARLIRVKAQEAANKAQEAAAQASGQTVAALDFTGYGDQTWPEGTRHVGQWQNGKPTGYGIRFWTDGKRYEGQWLDDQRDGYGIQTWRTGERYEGEWLAGRKNGYGVYYWEDGQYYQGEFENGIISGHGILTWPDGQHYQGEFSDDAFNGRGTLYSPKGTVLKAGIWRNGELQK